MADWRTQLLKMLQARPTPQNLRFLSNWQRWEGGHTNNDARYNWLNTTMDAPGAVRSINSVGVKAFGSQREGVNALAMTILNGRYGDIVAGLRSGNPYGADLAAGLSTWVSGSPTGNLSYAQKVMGGTGNPKGPQKSVTAAGPEPTRKGGSLAGLSGDPMDAFRIAFKDNPKILSFLESLPSAIPTSVGIAPSAESEPGLGIEDNGKSITLPTQWKGTHVTDGLGWGTRTAADIMGAPGTMVGAPEAGTIIRHGSAQGGQSLYFRADSGATYWIGHIANALPVGTRVKRGGRIAVISPDHPRPHVHLDRQG